MPHFFANFTPATGDVQHGDSWNSGTLLDSTANEELQATNEELLASNEVLQSTNEELQTTFIVARQFRKQPATLNQ